MKPAPHDATNDVTNIRFWMIFCGCGLGIFDSRRVQSVFDFIEVDLRFASGCFTEGDNADFMFVLRVHN